MLRIIRRLCLNPPAVQSLGYKRGDKKGPAPALDTGPAVCRSERCRQSKWTAPTKVKTKLPVLASSASDQVPPPWRAAYAPVP